jgi:hypothetical protein
MIQNPNQIAPEDIAKVQRILFLSCLFTPSFIATLNYVYSAPGKADMAPTFAVLSAALFFLPLLQKNMSAYEKLALLGEITLASVGGLVMGTAFAYHLHALKL